MPPRTYGIHPRYRARHGARYFDDRLLTDEWQREVYVAARDLMRAQGLHSVVDVGCGSAYKLLDQLGDHDTLGIDVSPTYEWLLQTHPTRRWLRSDLAMAEPPAADLVIASDVVEHVVDPDALVGFIKRISSRFVILSTPSRDLLYGRRFWKAGFRGPPANPHHVREWTFREFGAYIGQHFDVLHHGITNRAQGTQMIVCRPLDIPDDRSTARSPATCRGAETVLGHVLRPGRPRVWRS